MARSLTLAVFFFLLLALGAAADSSGKQVYPQWGPLAPGPYRVGFHSSVVFDPSRSYRYVLSFLEAYLREDARAAAFLASDAGGKAILDKLVAVEATPAGPQILTEATVIDLVMTKGIDEALEHLRQAIAQDPALFPEQRLTRMAEQLLWTGQYDEEALALLTWVVERFPGSARAYEMMGNVYFWNMGDYEAARTHYRRAAELDRTLRIENYLEQLEALLPQ